MESKNHDRFFLPGQNLTLWPQWRRQASPRYHKATVLVPGRLHFGVLDFSRMAPGLGGGGLGISTDTVSHTITIRRSPDQDGCDIPSGRHLLALFKRCVGYAADDIGIYREQSIRHTHSGFGSNVSFNTAVMAGLNALFGSPFTPQDLWDMVTQNYIENAPDGNHLYFGLDTGVGEACFLYGGLVWVDGAQGQGRYIGNVATPELWVVTAVGDRINLTGEILRSYGEGAALSADTETALVASHFMDCEKQYGESFRRFFHQRMVPALMQNDFKKVLALGWELNQVSNVKVLEGIYRTDVLRALNSQIQAEGALYAGMSSAGPGYFAFAPDKQTAERLSHYLERHFGNYFKEFKVGRAGLKLTIALQTQAASSATDESTALAVTA